MVKRVMDPGIIKTKRQYCEALAEIERLAAEDPAIGTADGDRLALLAKWVDEYESRKFAFARPDSHSAMRFRIEEQGG